MRSDVPIGPGLRTLPRTPDPLPERPLSPRATFLLLAAPAALVALAFHPAPEPQRDILLTSAPDGQAQQIWLMGPDGSEPRPLSPEVPGLQERFPVWSPDGTGIAFLSNRHAPGEARPAIFIMNADGTDAWKAGPAAIPYQGAPDFSPDGTQIVFAGGRMDDEPLKTDLYILDVFSSKVRRLTSFDAFVACPRWSPDGEAILFSKDIDELLIFHIPSGRIARALPTGVEGACGDWSPDGSQLAFSSGPDGQLPNFREILADPGFPQEIFVLDRTLGEFTHLPQAGPHATYPRWSRDGQRIVFQGHIPPGEPRHPDFMPLPHISELYVMQADGSEVRRLTHNSQMDGHPSW